MADYLDGFNNNPIEDYETSVNTTMPYTHYRLKSTKAWEYLYRDYYTALCSYVYKIVGDESVSQDVVQDSLIGIWKADLHFSHMEKLTCYLYKAVYTNAIQYLRTERLHHTLLQSYGEEEVEISDQHFALTVQEELTRQLRLCIQELPEEQRKIIHLSLEGLSGKEIADKLGISIHTVKTQKNRSFKYLRSKLGGSFYLLFLLAGQNLPL